MSQQTSPTDIIVYSRSGHSRRAAEELGRHLDLAPHEVTTPNYAWPILGWLAAARDGLKGRAVALDQPLEPVRDGLVVLVGPVWAGGAAAPLNTVIDRLAPGRAEVAVLLTCGDPKAPGTPLDKIAARLGRPLKAGMVLSNRVQSTGDGRARLEAFAAGLDTNATSA